MTRKSGFISVAIAIKINSDSNAFVKWFEDQDHYVAKTECETHKWYIHFAPLPHGDANITIKRLCEVIRQLPPVVRKGWDDADHREFFVGYEVGDKPVCFPEHFDIETLTAAIELGAGIGIALYPAQPTNEDGLPAELL